jgi:TolB protein
MKLHTLLAFAALAAPVLRAQVDLSGILTAEQARPVIAVPDLRGNGNAQANMDTFNRTLFTDLQDSGVFRMSPKSMYPVEVPQRPQDFRPPVNGQRQGPWFSDWSNAPAGANYLTFGYTAVQDSRLVLFGWLYNVQQPDLSNAQVIGKLYFADISENGARKLAHDFAADILRKFGVEPVMGSKIYYTSTRSGNREIWAMDWDGANKKQLTHLRSITNFAAVSPDAARLAFTTYAKGTPQIMMLSLETGRILPFYNQQASLNGTPSFAPDGRLLFSSTSHVGPGRAGSANVYECNLDGSGLRRLAISSAIEMEAKVNPKNSNEVVMTSGRSGPPQVYKMNRDGTDVVRLTSGEGDAVNPSWHPNGQHIAFSWTRGYDPGNYNVFVMDVTTRQVVQLTRGAGRNENPSWAPDGRHIVFSSSRNGSLQIWSMLADGTQLRQLTHEGRNTNPVWGR